MTLIILFKYDRKLNWKKIFMSESSILTNFGPMRYIVSSIVIFCCLTLPLSVIWARDFTQIQAKPIIGNSINQTNSAILLKLYLSNTNNNNYNYNNNNNNNQAKFNPVVDQSGHPKNIDKLKKETSIKKQVKRENKEKLDILDSMKISSELTINYFEIHILIFYISVISCIAFIQLYFYFKLIAMIIAIVIYVIGFHLLKIYDDMSTYTNFSQTILRLQTMINISFYVLFLHIINRRVCYSFIIKSVAMSI